MKSEDLAGSMNLTKVTYLATRASSYCIKSQGLPLGRLPLYSLTVSEILRLHLLSSGARINDIGARWRYQERGGYTSEDDPGLHLRLHQPHIIKALAVHNVVQLPVGDKLKIISCLINQLLTYADVRDLVEERLEQSRQMKLDLRMAQAAERRREQEYVTAKVKLKREGKENSNLETDLDNLKKATDRKRLENERKIEKLMKATSDYQIILG